METLGRMLGVLWAPGETLYLVSKKPKVLVPLIVLCAISLIAGLVSLTKLDAGELALRQLEKSPQGANMTAEQKQNTVRVVRTFAPVGVVVGALTPALITLVAAAIYFGIFTLIGREADFKTFFAVTIFAYVPLILRSLVSLVQILLIPQDQLDPNDLGSLSLAILLDRAAVGKVVYALAGIVDVGAIWIMILLVIGYKFVVRKSVGTGLRTAAVVAVYLFFSLIFAGLRMLQPG